MNATALRRYSRHLLIPEVGLRGQERLARSRVLVVGAGGLGSPALQYLAAAGVGTIGIVDDDAVDETNLQRQTIYRTEDVGCSKAIAAAARLHALNPFVEIVPHSMRLEASNARSLVRAYDVVLDCTDRFTARYCINDACHFEDKPDVYGSIFRFDGQVSVFSTQRGPCYRCLYPEPPPPELTPTCAEGGVLGAVAGIVGTWQAGEALKLVLNVGETLIGRLLLVDCLQGRTREVAFRRDPACRLCGEEPSVVNVETYGEAPQESAVLEIDPERLDDALLHATLLDVREPHEAVLGSVHGAQTIPASQLEARMSELDSARRYVVACRAGVQSQWVLRRLQEAGFGRLAHLRGGLLAYAAQREGFDIF